MVYTAGKPPLPESSEQLRQRIPGWGADLDPRDRPSVPRERFDLPATGAHWDFPEQQPEVSPRERSVEHAFLTPVFGTSCPPKGLSGMLRRLAYAKFSEARAAHWLILLGADRVDWVESSVTSALRGQPDHPIRESGVRGEITHHGLASRWNGRRADGAHQWMDPFVVAAPWAAGAAVALYGIRRIPAVFRKVTPLGSSR